MKQIVLEKASIVVDGNRYWLKPNFRHNTPVTYVSTSIVALALGVNERTVRYWCDNHYVIAVKDHVWKIRVFK